MVVGKGAVTATLAGTRLTINGSFEGLPASRDRGAGCIRALPRALAERPFADLTITKAASGTISGAVTLTPDQLEALKQGRLYLQVYSEQRHSARNRARPQPDVDHSNLWGWLLR